MPPLLRFLLCGIFVHPALAAGLTVLVAVLGAPAAVHAADAPQRRYDLPAGGAETSLKLFSEQSGRGVIFSTDALKEIQTNAVQGEFSAREALERMVTGTGLVIGIEEKTGAFAVRKGRPTQTPQGRRPAQGATARARSPPGTMKPSSCLPSS